MKMQGTKLCVALEYVSCVLQTQSSINAFRRYKHLSTQSPEASKSWSCSAIAERVLSVA